MELVNVVVLDLIAEVDGVIDDDDDDDDDDGEIIIMSKIRINDMQIITIPLVLCMEVFVCAKGISNTENNEVNNDFVDDDDAASSSDDDDDAISIGCMEVFILFKLLM